VREVQASAAPLRDVLTYENVASTVDVIGERDGRWQDSEGSTLKKDRRDGRPWHQKTMVKKDDLKVSYEQFGGGLEFGVHEDSTHRAKAADSLRSRTSWSGTNRSASRSALTV